MMMVVKGDVNVTAAKTQQKLKAKVGQKVGEGDVIETGKDSRAKIVMADKNVLNISPDSKVVIEKYVNDAKTGEKKVDLKVLEGKLRASVEQKYDGEKNTFQIKTPTAVAGVRGTDFITGFNSSTRVTSVVTFSGVVAVGLPGANGTILKPVMVQPGQSTSVENGKAAEAPKAVPVKELQQMNTTTQAEAPSPAGNRSTASTSPSMVTNQDLGPGVAQETKFPGGPDMGPNFNPNNMNNPQINRNPFVEGASQNGNTKAIIEIQHQ